MEYKEFEEFRSSGVQEFRSSGVQEFRSSGVQEFSLSRMAKLQARRAFYRESVINPPVS
jgi:hypothetical protein